MKGKIEERLGEDEHNLMIDALRGKTFIYTGVDDEGLSNEHKYEILDIAYGIENVSHRCSGTLIITDKTNSKELNVRLEKLNFLRELK
jgi:hypothetical protein